MAVTLTQLPLPQTVGVHNSSAEIVLMVDNHNAHGTLYVADGGVDWQPHGSEHRYWMSWPVLSRTLRTKAMKRRPKT